MPRLQEMRMPAVNPPPFSFPLCMVCKTAQARFQIRALNTGRVSNVCSMKCMLSWCLGFSFGSVQNMVQKLLKGMSK